MAKFRVQPRGSLGLGWGVPVPGHFWGGVWSLCPEGILGWGLGSWAGVGESLC